MSNVVRLMDVSEESADIKQSQNAIASLLDREAVAKKMFENLVAIDELEERLNKGAQLHNDCADVVSLCKDLKDVLSRVQKRMEKMQGVVNNGLFDEVKSSSDGDEIETDDFVLKTKINPPSVVVDDLKIVPKKYRNEPKPLPEWKDWAVDKNAVKSALTKEKVKKIDGVHLSCKESLVIKLR